MKTLCRNTKSTAIAALSIISSVLSIANANAAAQSNQHSFSSSIATSFSFEQHAQDYANSAWTPDNEFSINVNKLNAIWVKAKAKRNLSNEPKVESRLDYSAQISDKSFGISAQFKF